MAMRWSANANEAPLVCVEDAYLARRCGALLLARRRLRNRTTNNTALPFTRPAPPPPSLHRPSGLRKACYPCRRCCWVHADIVDVVEMVLVLVLREGDAAKKCVAKSERRRQKAGTWTFPVRTPRPSPPPAIIPQESGITARTHLKAHQ